MTAIELGVHLFVRKVSTPQRPTTLRPIPAPALGQLSAS
jgi:hypothetical protein